MNITSSSSCSNFDVDIYGFMKDSSKLSRLHTELVHFYTDKLKDKVKKVTVCMIYDTSGFREVHNTDNIPLLLMNLFCIL